MELDKLVSVDVLSRILYFKILDDVQDVYKNKNGDYQIYVKDREMCLIVTKLNTNIVARSTILGRQTLRFWSVRSGAGARVCYGCRGAESELIR